MARKFVLDANMSKYLAEMSDAFYRGGLRKRVHALENARQMARLPHPVTWIEFDYAAYQEHAKALGAKVVMLAPEGSPWPKRYGWLLHQHETIETAFLAMELRSMVSRENRAWIHPVGYGWRSDDGPMPWNSFKDIPWATPEQLVQVRGYDSRQAILTAVFPREMTLELLGTMVLPEWEKHGVKAVKSILPHLPLRDVWALLATINDLPISKVEVRHGSAKAIRRHPYKAYLKHTVLHLDVPQAAFRTLIKKTATAMHKRAHQVRGHWRRDWRKPLAALCVHVFDAAMMCQHCGGHKIWVPEHQRGDASIGLVTHDYNIHHDKRPE